MYATDGQSAPTILYSVEKQVTFMHDSYYSSWVVSYYGLNLGDFIFMRGKDYIKGIIRLTIIYLKNKVKINNNYLSFFTNLCTLWGTLKLLKMFL